MNPTERSAALQNAVSEWQKKYGINDGDPLLAAVELFQITFACEGSTPAGSRSLVFDEFRDSIEAIDQRTRAFTKQATELSQQLRAVAYFGGKYAGESSAGLWFGAVLLLAVGIAIGRFVS